MKENENDILSDFTVTESGRDKKFFKIVVILYLVYNITSLAVFFLSLKLGHIGIDILFSSLLMALQVLVVRLLPPIALILFVIKKKAGWLLILLLSVIDLLYKGIFLVNIGMNLHTYLQLSPYLIGGLLLTFLLSLSITFLILLDPVSRLFKISNSAKLLTILCGIMIFALLKFYLADLILRHLVS